MLENIPFTITVSTASLGVKIGLIWLIYRIASLSSVNKVLNKFVAYILLISSFINFLDFNRYLVNFLGRFKANFGSFEVSIYKAFLFFVVIMAVFWFNKVIIESIKKILDTTTVNTNVKALFVKILSICLFIIIFLMGLGAIGFDIKSLTIFGSALAVGLGFGLQKLVSNFISGITISFEEIIKEGDIISIDDKREIKGIVKSLNMRYLLLCEFDGKEVMIPNDTIITSNIANLTHSNNNLRIRIDLRVPHDIDLETFQKDVLKLMRKNVYSSKFEESMFHVESVSESGINIFLHFWIDDPMEINASRTSIMFELISFLKERNIQIPPIVTKLTIDKIGIPV
jgi:small-conductance mechanosensitive channel